MKNPINFGSRLRMLMALLCIPVALCGVTFGQAAPSALGTVKSVSGKSITIANDKGGATVTVEASDSTQVQALAPGSTDIKTATPSDLGSVAVGDRMLVVGTAGDSPDKLTAKRLILMKAGDLAKVHAQEQADWARNGVGGLVKAVDPAAGTITVGTGTTTTAGQTTTIHTSGTTKFERYASDSVKFEDAKPGKLADVQVGDQLRARGQKTADNVQAVEVISGTFKNIAGTIASIDAASGAITIKDLGTKKNVVVKVTPNSDLRNIPEQAARRFAQQAAPAGALSGDEGGGGGGAAGGDAPAAGGNRGGGQRPGAQAGGQRGAGGPGGPGGGRRLGAADLSQMIPSFPKANLADLKAGQAVMVTATQATPTSPDVTAVTVLSGVEPILTAAPTMMLSPGGTGGAGGGMGGGDAGGGGFGGGGQ